MIRIGLVIFIGLSAMSFARGFHHQWRKRKYRDLYYISDEQWRQIEREMDQAAWRMLRWTPANHENCCCVLDPNEQFMREQRERYVIELGEPVPDHETMLVIPEPMDPKEMSATVENWLRERKEARDG